MKMLILVLFAVLLVPIIHVSAFEYHTDEDFMVDSDPKFCLVNIPDDPNYDQENIIMFERIVKDSISAWVEKLEEYTGNDWNIDYEFVNFNDPDNPIHEKNCDVFVSFVDDIDGGNTAGTTFISEQTGKVTIAILYSHIEYIESEDENYYYYTPKYSGYLADESYMKAITKHEISHALGLDHYTTNDSSLLQRWDSREEQLPSIMIKNNPDATHDKITELDIEKIISIYGTDGFGESSIVIPDWVRNNAKWWGDGLISDDEYVSAIQYMIKNKIIVV